MTATDRMVNLLLRYHSTRERFRASRGQWPALIRVYTSRLYLAASGIFVLLSPGALVHDGFVAFLVHLAIAAMSLRLFFRVRRQDPS